MADVSFGTFAALELPFAASLSPETLGAGRRRIISQLLTESVVLSLAGGALGLALGYFGVRALLTMNPGNIPLIGERGTDISMDWRVLGFTLLVSVLTGVLFGPNPSPSCTSPLRKCPMA